MLRALLPYLPQSDGWLGHWQLFIASTAFFNTLQNFMTLKLTRRLYSNTPPSSVTPLQARTFAVWTLTSAIVRLYAAYHINDKTIYDMAMFTYLIAFGHFSSEILIFRSANIGGPVMSTVIVSVTSLIWMFTQYEFYIKSG